MGRDEGRCGRRVKEKKEKGRGNQEEGKNRREVGKWDEGENYGRVWRRLWRGFSGMFSSEKSSAHHDILFCAEPIKVNEQVDNSIIPL